MVKLFIDSADLEEIMWAYDLGVVCGVTTNPLFLSGPEARDKLAAILEYVPTADPVSVQVRGTGETWLADAKGILAMSPRTVVKVPCCQSGIALVKRLWTSRERFNVTGIMTPAQGILAAASGAGYASVFWCRSWDALESPERAITFARSWGNAIVGSIRSPQNVVDAALAGADIVTVPTPILRQMFVHSKTEEFIAQCAAKE